MVNKKYVWWITGLVIILSLCGLAVSVWLFNFSPLFSGNEPEVNLIIFSPTQNLYNVSSSTLQSQTSKTQWTLTEFFLLFGITIENSVYIVTNTSAYLKVAVPAFPNTFLRVIENEFQISWQDEVIRPVLGIGVDFDATNADLVPTVCKFIGWSGSYNIFDGQPLVVPDAPYFKIMIILLDGMRYDLFNSFLMPKLALPTSNILWNGSSLAGVPPMTPVGTTLLLTGIFAPENGVTGRSTHQIADGVQTIFEIAENQGLRTEIVEGSIQFISIHADLESWNPDQNYDGSTDDEIYSVVNNSIILNQSDLLFVHFHNPDDLGHSGGLNSSEYLSKLNELGNFIEYFWDILPFNSAMFIVSDHGMHEINENGSPRGVHDSVIFEDISIPICILEK